MAYVGSSFAPAIVGIQHSPEGASGGGGSADGKKACEVLLRTNANAQAYESACGSSSTGSDTSSGRRLASHGAPALGAAAALVPPSWDPVGLLVLVAALAVILGYLAYCFALKALRSRCAVVEA